MKSFFWIIFSLFLFSCQGNSYDEADPYYEKSSGKSLRNNNYQDLEFFESIKDTNSKLIKSFWPNGNIQAMGYFYRGERNGKWKLFSEEGKVVFEGYYKLGQKHGPQTSFLSNGSISIIEVYSNDELIFAYYYNSSGNSDIE